ncbi:uncharacterized protein [Apostichopus japonicus]|uniref:uncharacterized protein isoform X1 n=1 Tax=Stichopus japonicus TaxID=307972 RepID=UPI003AB7B8AB
MANCLVTWTYIFLAGLLIRQNIDFVIAMGLCEFENLMMKNAGGGQDQRDTISTLGTDMSDQSATTVYSTDGMRISPSTDEMTTVMPKTDTISTLGTDMSDQSATTVYSTDGMRISPSTDELTTRFENLVSTTVMPTAESCPNNMKWMNCSCQTTCDDPEGLHGCFKSCNDEPRYTCVCPDGFQIRDEACIPLEECGCYHSPTGVISNGSSHVNVNCTRRCTCENDVLQCEEYSCSHNATCQKQGQSSSCECKEGYWGNGTTCQVITNCQDVHNGLSTKEGIYLIHPPSWAHEPFQVYCKGGWMLFQRRVDASVSFFNDWITYRDGFGDLNSSFWLGNEKLHVISAERDHQLRIDIWFNTTNDASEYLHYNLFRISSEATKYEITLGSYTGSFDYDYMDYHRDMKFTTYDQDNDLVLQNCAISEFHPGGWWFNGCHAIMLNGIYGGPWDTGICLFQRNTRDYNCSVVAVHMKIKPL